MKCPVCSAELPATARFCGSCGTTLNVAPPPPSPPPPVPPPPPMQHAEPRPIVSPPPSYGAPGPPPSLEKKYRMLRASAMVIKIGAFVLGAIFIIFGLVLIIGGIGGAAQSGGGLGSNPNFSPAAGAAALMGGFVGGLMMIVYGFIVFIFLYSYAGFLQVSMDVEENTRRTSEMLARR